MTGWISDVSSAWRALRRSRVATGVAAGSLALALSVSVAVFSLGNALLLRPLPVPEPERLVRVGMATGDSGFEPLSLVEVEALRERSRSLETVVATRWNTAPIRLTGGAVEAGVEVVSETYFAALRVPMAVGRGFSAADAQAAVAVLSHDIWSRALGRDASVLGRRLSIAGTPFTIVGVAARGFEGTMPGFGVALWIPLSHYETALPRDGVLSDPATRSLFALGVMRRSESSVAVAAELAALPPPRLAGEETPRRYRVSPGAGLLPDMARLARPAFLVLLGVTGLVVLAAGSNLAILLLARGVRRQGELALRRALGATPLQLVRLLTIESVLIASLAGLGALVVSAALSVRFGRLGIDVGIPIEITPAIDARVVAFTAAVALGVGVVFGALSQARRRVSVEALLRTHAPALAHGGSRSRGAFIVGQVAVSTLLLCVTALLVRSALTARDLPPGFDRSNLFVASADPSTVTSDAAGQVRLWDELLREVAADPRVESAALALFAPQGARSDRLVAALPEGERAVYYNVVSPGYFEAMGIPLLAGRQFAGREAGSSAAPAIVVSRALAESLGGVSAALGQTLSVRERDGARTLATIVGVHRDFAFRSPGEPARPLVHFSFGQRPRPDLLLHVRARQPSARSFVEQRLRERLPDSPVRVTPIGEVTRFTERVSRAATALIGAAGGLALALTLCGLFAVASFLAARRSRELALRRALGATPLQLTSLIGHELLPLVAAGFGAGLLAAIGVGRLLRSVLVGVGAFDPVSAAFAAAMVALVASAAVALPTRMALRGELAEVLRAE